MQFKLRHQLTVVFPIGFALLLVIVVLTGYIWATWRYFVRLVPGGNDFTAHYTAWQAYFHSGVSPYSDEAASYTQQVIYGRPAKPGEDQNRLTYPFYSIVIQGPFALIDYEAARAIYMVTLQVALFVSLILAMKLVSWKPRPWLLFFILAWSLVDYSQARGVILGQFAIFGFFSLIACLFLLKQKQDFWAGSILVLGTVKPTLFFLIIPFLLIWALFRRRWLMLGGFTLTLLLMMIGSWLALPTWFQEWLYRMGRYSEYTVGQSPVWLVAHQFVPILSTAGEWVIYAILLVSLGYAWIKAFAVLGEGEFMWTLSFTIVVSSLVVPRSATTNYVLFLLPILWTFAVLDRNTQWGKMIISLIMLGSFAGMWWLHFSTVVGNQEQAIMFMPAPVLIGFVLLAWRKQFLRDGVKSGVFPSGEAGYLSQKVPTVLETAGSES